MNEIILILVALTIIIVTAWITTAVFVALFTKCNIFEWQPVSSINNKLIQLMKDKNA